MKKADSGSSVTYALNSASYPGGALGCCAHGLCLGEVIGERMCRSDGELLSGDLVTLVAPTDHTECLAKRRYRKVFKRVYSTLVL